MSKAAGGRYSCPATEPLIPWAAGENSYTEPGSLGWPVSVSSFHVAAEEEDDSDADSATSSDTGNAELPEIPGLDATSQADAAELI